MSLPTVSICGNISKLNMKYLPSGKAITSFQIECAEKNNKGEWNNLYIKGECWEKSAEFVNQYFKDGDVAIVTGKLFTNVYDKQDGTKAYEIKFLFPNVSFPPKAKESNSQGSYQQAQQQQQYNAPQQQVQNNHQMPIDIDNDEILF